MARGRLFAPVFESFDETGLVVPASLAHERLETLRAERSEAAALEADHERYAAARLEKDLDRMDAHHVQRRSPGGWGLGWLREWVAPSGLYVGPSRGNAAGSLVRPVGLAASSVAVGSLLVACGGGSSNQLPVAQFTSAPAQASAGSSIDVAGTASDPDGSVSKVVFSLGSDSVTDTSAPYSATLTVPSSAGSYQVEMKAVDNLGGSRVVQSPLEVLACSVNPASKLASDHGVDPSWVSVLGDDCTVDTDENFLIAKLLPDLQVYTTPTIAHSFTKRFVDDDGQFKHDERVTLDRAFYGRRNADGVLIDRGLFARYDENVGKSTAIAIPNAWWIPTVWTPFDHAVLPTVNINGYGEPYFTDGNSTSADIVYLPNWGNNTTVFDQLGSAVSPTPDLTAANDGPDMQMVFSQDQKLVNSLPESVKIVQIQYQYNYGDQGQQVRNAFIDVVPVDRSPSLGFSDLDMWVGHLDVNRLAVQVGDVVPPEGTFGFTELHLGGGIQVQWGFYSADGPYGSGGRYNNVDVTYPAPSGQRMLLPQIVVRPVDANGDPTKVFFGAFQDTAAKNGTLMTDQGLPAMEYTPPPQP